MWGGDWPATEGRRCSSTTATTPPASATRSRPCVGTGRRARSPARAPPTSQRTSTSRLSSKPHGGPGARAAPIETQGQFLTRLGIIPRAEQLIRASPDKAETIGRQLSRLIAPDKMGDLFKVCALSGPGVELP